MNIRKFILIVNFLNYICLAAALTFVEYSLVMDRVILPDLRLGYTVNYNLIELVVLGFLIIVQTVIFVLLLKGGDKLEKRI